MSQATDHRYPTVDITEEMQQSYIDYAMSVIANRALPDVRDGLKPVHRRILYAMREAGNTPDRPYKKSARTVGDVLGKYHPHSDSAVYDALVRMAQDFTMRYPLIDGHGNFGSIDGDPPAAMRYTEARLSRLAMELMTDLDKETVDFMPNFDEEMEEPTVLPARFPNLLVNGSSGIAVGMATNIPPHNLAETIDAVNALIDNPDLTSLELMRYVKGPDFPTGGIILGKAGIRSAYEKGRGVITIRARTEIETPANGRQRIVVTEIPYQVSKARLIEKIAELVRERKIEGITDLRDETDRSGLRLVIELSRTAYPQVVLNQLFKHTMLQQSFGIIMLALVDGEPKVLSLRDVLRAYIRHQQEVVVRRSTFDLKKAEARAHILEGLRIALDHIDRVISLIRSSESAEAAKEGLMQEFSLTEQQAQAILDMRLQRLVALEREKIENEYAELLKTIAWLRELLADEKKVLQVIKEELTEIRNRFADERRTTIEAETEEIELEDLIADEPVVITLSHHGYIKRLPLSTYRQQRRGGRGTTGVRVKDEDFVKQLFSATTHQSLLFFTNRGRVLRRKVYEIPEASRTARGTALVNVVDIAPGEQVTTVMPIDDFSPDYDLIMATRNGIVKKTNLSEFANIRRSGIYAISLDEGDELIAVRLTKGGGQIMLVTRGGLAIRFNESDVRAMGRTARGVLGIRLQPDDHVVAMDVVDHDADVLVVTENGYGKRTRVSDYRTQTRGGKGIKTMNVTKKTGPVAASLIVSKEAEILVITASGIVLRTSVAGISRQGRSTQGVTLIRVGENDKVVGLAEVTDVDDDA